MIGDIFAYKGPGYIWKTKKLWSFYDNDGDFRCVTERDLELGDVECYMSTWMDLNWVVNKTHRKNSCMFFLGLGRW